MKLDFDIHCQKGGFTLDASTGLTDDICGIYGTSGSGKSTLLRCLAGLETCTGSITYDGKSWLDQDRSLPPSERNTGYLPQEPTLFPRMTARQNIEFASRLCPHAQPGDVEYFADLVGCTHLHDHSPSQLSGGEKQRVGLARTLCSRPSLLLLDEPFSALDDDSRDALLETFASLLPQLGIPTLLVSHSACELRRLTTTTIIVADGKIQSSGATADQLPSSKMINGEILSIDPKTGLATVRLG